MKRFMASIVALCALVGVNATPVSAMPVLHPSSIAIVDAAPMGVQEVQYGYGRPYGFRGGHGYRRHFGYRRRYGYGRRYGFHPYGYGYRHRYGHGGYGHRRYYRY